VRRRQQTENAVELDVVTWLRIAGWIVRRQHVGTYYTRDGRPVSMGERGECDWRAMRVRADGLVEYLEFEAKATGQKPRPEQDEYMAKRRRQGFTVIWADSLAAFKDKYDGTFAR